MEREQEKGRDGVQTQTLNINAACRRESELQCTKTLEKERYRQAALQSQESPNFPPCSFTYLNHNTIIIHSKYY